MKLGFITAICDGMTFEEVVDFAAENGLECLEVACWPQVGAQRRYAGVSHIDVANLTQEKADEIKAYCKKKGVEISSLAYYPNTLEPNLEKRQSYIDHLYKLMDASVMLDVNMITTFVGRDPKKSVSENLEIVKEVWPPIVKYAEEKGVKIGIENCPMLFTEDEWPGGQNLMTSPANWRKVFEIIDSPNFGINYDPSHFVWQQIDYIKPIYEFKDKIFHVHYKDIKVFKDKLADVGTMATPLEYMSPKLPGLGDVDWGKYVSALTDIGYDGYTCIEVEDKAFEKSMETGNIKLIAEADVDFHDVIYQATDNTKLVTLLSNIREQMYRYRVEYLKDVAYYPILIQEHAEIVRGLEAKDQALVVDAMNRHVSHQAMAMKAVIQKQDNDE